METTEVTTTRPLGALTIKARDALKIVTALPKHMKKKEPKVKCCCRKEDDQEELASVEQPEEVEQDDRETLAQRCFQWCEDSCEERLCLKGTAMVVWIFVWCLLTAVPCVMIAIGKSGLHLCDVQPYIPVYLIVGGSVFLFTTIPAVIIAVLFTCEINEEDFTDCCAISTLCLSIPIVLCLLFTVAWSIAGSYWVYSSYPKYQSHNATLPNFCDERTYKFSFWLLNSCYILAGTLLLGACSCCACKCCCCDGDCDICDD